MIRLYLEFHDVPEDLEDVTANIYVEDQSEVDAPSRQLYSEVFGPFSIIKLHPTVQVDVGFSVSQDVQEPAIIIRAHALTQTKQPVTFLNTTTTYLPNAPCLDVKVPMLRIR